MIDLSKLSDAEVNAMFYGALQSEVEAAARGGMAAMEEFSAIRETYGHERIRRIEHAYAKSQET